MNILLLAGIVALIGMVVFLLLAILHTDAKNDRHFTYVPTGRFKFVVAGNKLIRVLSNIDGYSCEKDNIPPWTVQNEGSNFEPPQSWFEKMFGATFVSFLYPIKRIHEFTVVADKLKPEAERTGKPLKDWVQYEERRVKELLFRFPHPLYISDIELGGDKWQINLLLMLDLQITNPAVVVMIYNGKVLEQVDAAVKSAVIDYCNGYTEKVSQTETVTHSWTYDSFLTENKGRGSDIEEMILDLNKESEAKRKDGLEDRFGISIKSAWVQDLDLSEEQEELIKASKAKALQEELAKAGIAEAEGKARQTIINAEAAAKQIVLLAEANKTALMAEGAGQAEAWSKLISSMRGFGIAPDDANDTLKSYVETGNIAKLQNLTTLITSSGGKKKNPSLIINPK
ncbi:MAG: hypothetical protein WDZ73_00965 [Candidatus Paceibacterota bacterium]